MLALPGDLGEGSSAFSFLPGAGKDSTLTQGERGLPVAGGQGGISLETPSVDIPTEVRPPPPLPRRAEASSVALCLSQGRAAPLAADMCARPLQDVGGWCFCAPL